MQSRMRILGVVTALGVSAVAGASVASTVHAAVGKGAAPAALATPSKPSGYKVVISSLIAAAAGQQTHGSVACPTTKRGVQTEPTGGGAVISGTDTNMNINSSYPFGTAWDVDVNNASANNGSFDVYAVCSLPTKGYTVATASFAGSAGMQSHGDATCPSGTKVLGGGAFSSSGNTSDNINSSYPSDASNWVVDMNNASGANSGFNVYAVCSKYPAKTGYQIVYSASVTNAPQAQTLATATCPSGTVPLGGGGLSSSISTNVSLNSTLPNGTSWSSYEDNNSTNNETITASAICAH